MSEATYNQVLKKSIRREGIYAYKTADRANAGIPDIYVAGGNWVEGKLIKMPKRNGISIMAHIDPAQRIVMNSLTAAGDNCFVAVYFVDDYGLRYFLFVPWMHMRAVIAWKVEDIHWFAAPVSNQSQSMKMDRFFSKKIARHYYSEWWDLMWDDWCDDNKGRWEWPDAAKDIVAMGERDDVSP